MKITGEDLMKIKDENGEPAMSYKVTEHDIDLYNSFLVSELNIPDSLIDQYIEQKNKKYYIHLIDGELGYLNLSRSEANRYFIDSKFNNDYTRTQFTTAEIDDLCERYPHIGFWACAEEVSDNV